MPGPMGKQGTGSERNAWTYGKANEQDLRGMLGPTGKQGTGSEKIVWTQAKARNRV